MQLFISHASEDKPDFVRPLADALKGEFKVWYDEYELTVGDSLLAKIDQGLATSDFGVVVLSPAFFAKRWPRAELDGLFALEAKKGKIILPVWKDIDENGVMEFSPILAGRLAARASDGIPAVVSQLRQAVTASQRTREISKTQSLTNRFRQLDSSIIARRRAEQLIMGEEGVPLVSREFEKLAGALHEQVTAISAELKTIKFQFRRDTPEPGAIVLAGRFRMGIFLTGLAINSSSQAVLLCNLHDLGCPLPLGNREEPRKLEEKRYYPWFGLSGEVVWRDSTSSVNFIGSDELLDLWLTKLHATLEKTVTGRS
ncbi:MAG: toll/interleukin-1 receptor domain-containing protein [Verrucomicrobiia bacterium]